MYLDMMKLTVAFHNFANVPKKTRVIQNIQQTHLVTVEMTKIMSKTASRLLFSKAVNTIHLYVSNFY